MIQTYGQRDPRWAKMRLGASNLLMERFGCTTSCLAMGASYFGERILPSEIANNSNNYTPDGLIVWSKLKFVRMRWMTRVRRRDDHMIKKALSDPRCVVLLNVAGGAHWVLATGTTLFGKDYWCIDPWDGTRCQVLKRYKDITGYALFIKK